MHLLLLTLLATACSPTYVGTAAPSPEPNTVAETPPPQRWRGDECKTDVDCTWDDQCLPNECIAGHPEAKHANCDESTPPPGSCGCIAGACTLNPTNPKPSAAGTCSSNVHCSLKQSLGQCEVGDTNPAPYVDIYGPYCACNGGRCEFGWVDAVPCQSDGDCWYERQPVVHPVGATKPRHLPFKPCVDGEIDSVCRGPEGQKSCMVLSYGC